MKQCDPNPTQTRRRPTRLGLGVTVLLVLGLLTASSASAAYEGVGHFAGILTAPAEPGVFPEEAQLGGVSGMAVNIAGAGGVPAGTVYAATRDSKFETMHIAMYEPSAGGGLTFSQAWELTSAKEPTYERCGPALGTECSPHVDGLPSAIDVEVDQTTGNVFALLRWSGIAGRPMIVEYTPDGSEEITRFGEETPGNETVAQSPSKIHSPTYPAGMAMDGAGSVYVFDLNNFGNFEHRLMVFKPQTPDDYEHYVYAGEVLAGKFGTPFPTLPAIDAAGHIYTAESRGSDIEMYEPQTPSSYPGPPYTPTCRFEYAKGGIESIAVNPDTGELFFFTYKKEGGFKFKLVHQLGPCDEETGEFEEIDKFEVKPERGDLSAMVFDPVRQLDPTRPPGVLYAGAQGPVPGSGEGKGEPGQSSLGYIFSRAVAAPPEVGAQSVSHVTATTAQLHAEINSKGAASRYSFQYLSEAEYQANEPSDRFAGAREAPPGGASLAAAQKALSVPASIAGLAPDTTYRYRAVATSHCSSEDPEEVCEGTGADASFHTFPTEAPVLPDGRAYELVSPAQKNGGEVFPANPSLDSCFGEGSCKPGGTALHFPMQSTPDGEAIVYEGQPFAHGEDALGENQYVAHRDSKAGWQTTGLSPTLAGSGSSQGYQAFGTDLNRGLLYQLDPTLSPEAPSEYANLYAQPTADPLALEPLLRAEPLNRPASGNGSFDLRYAGASADLSRIFFRANDVLTEETPFAPEAQDGGPGKFNLYEWAEGELSLVNVLPGNTETNPGASIGAPSAHSISDDGTRVFWSDQAGQLYLRENAETTVAIPDPGKFLAAAADGSEVLLSNGHLYDVETETTTDLTDGEGGFQGLVGQSDDLSRLYFVDTAVLDVAANEQGAQAQAGKFNLYAWEEGASRFVATLGAPDSSAWASSPTVRDGQASPNGRWLALLSEAPLTGYDNTGPCLGDGVGWYVSGACPEVFHYDSATGKLTCASCNPSGALPLGHSSLPQIEAAATLPQPHYLTNEGRLYFDTRDSLVPSDTNNGVEDVYQYEPGGVGTCERGAGCTQLISAGHEAVDSNFLAADEDGANVFFTTRDQLVLKDKDDAFDLYVAREGGGIPSETEVGRGECQGEACVPALSPPNDPTPGSSSFEGAGNVDEQKSAKKQKKKKRKKTKKKHAHKRAAKHNRGGSK